MTHHLQAWRGRKRQARGHQGEWLAIDGQKNNILASLCLASYLAANWLQKLETKHFLLRRSVCVRACVRAGVQVCVCVISQFDLFITKQNYIFVRSQFLPRRHFFEMFKSAIMEVELDDGGKHGKTTDGGN